MPSTSTVGLIYRLSIQHPRLAPVNPPRTGQGKKTKKTVKRGKTQELRRKEEEEEQQQQQQQRCRRWMKEKEVTASFAMVRFLPRAVWVVSISFFFDPIY